MPQDKYNTLKKQLIALGYTKKQATARAKKWLDSQLSKYGNITWRRRA